MIMMKAMKAMKVMKDDVDNIMLHCLLIKKKDKMLIRHFVFFVINIISEYSATQWR